MPTHVTLPGTMGQRCIGTAESSRERGNHSFLIYFSPCRCGYSLTDLLSVLIRCRASLGSLSGLGVSAESEVLLRFSLKEGLYKAIHPFVRRYVAFKEVRPPLPSLLRSERQACTPQREPPSHPISYPPPLTSTHLTAGRSHPTCGRDGVLHPAPQEL